MRAAEVMKTGEVAARLRLSPRKVREVATKNRIGFNAGGRAGFRFTEADVDALKEAMKPVEQVARRRRRAS